MTWASGDEDGENGNTNENKDAEKNLAWLDKQNQVMTTQ
jgi:hypothetical protein